MNPFHRPTKSHKSTPVSSQSIVNVPAFTGRNKFAESINFILSRETNPAYPFVPIDFASRFFREKFLVGLVFYVRRPGDYFGGWVRHSRETCSSRGRHGKRGVG